MIQATQVAAAPAKEPRKARSSHGVQGGSGEANRLAVVILEVLAGIHTPTQAAQGLGISVPRYYQLETRAVEGLVAACQSKPKGKQPSPQAQIAALQRELQQARRASARQQALLRVSQRSLGLKIASGPAEKTSADRDRAGRRRRRPTVRALKAVQALRKNVRRLEGETLQTNAMENGGAVAAATDPEGSKAG